jgi:hypothetical protein
MYQASAKAEIYIGFSKYKLKGGDYLEDLGAEGGFKLKMHLSTFSAKVDFSQSKYSSAQ